MAPVIVSAGLGGDLDMLWMSYTSSKEEKEQNKDVQYPVDQTFDGGQQQNSQSGTATLPASLSSINYAGCKNKL